jgi:hypothetical protein
MNRLEDCQNNGKITKYNYKDRLEKYKKNQKGERYAAKRQTTGRKLCESRISEKGEGIR